MTQSNWKYYQKIPLQLKRRRSGIMITNITEIFEWSLNYWNHSYNYLTKAFFQTVQRIHTLKSLTIIFS